jgi:starch synthase
MERFMFFSRAALEFMVVTGRQPDVLHLHDWQSSTVVRAASVASAASL